MMPVATSAIGEVSKDASPTIIIGGMACIRNCVIAPYSSGYPSGCVSELRQRRLENGKAVIGSVAQKVRFMAGVLSSSLTPL
jgi:hypothetical protein